MHVYVYVNIPICVCVKRFLYVDMYVCMFIIMHFAIYYLFTG